MLRQNLTGETFYLNLGPQHPSTHGVLRVLLRLDGEYIVEAEPIIGYIHRGHEHMGQRQAYVQFLPNTGRMDYLGALAYNHAYCLAVEKACGIEVPRRAEYIRTICVELNRISSHLLWLGAWLLDLGGVTPMIYCFDDREDIMDILGEVSGSRLTYCYTRFGGVARDVNSRFCDLLKKFIPKLKGRFKDYDTLVTKNVIFVHRAKDVGLISRDLALQYSLTGPCLRGSGVRYDVRRAEPYGLYPEFDFEIPTRPEGDCLARYLVRVAEMEQSLRIVEQALAGLPEGAYRNPDVPLWVQPPEGEYNFIYEAPRGQLGIYFVSDGGRVAHRMKWRTPSFSNLSVVPALLPNTLVADTIAILGSLDVVIPDIDR
ncbi:MAG: NADH-quinone oxidoreductase subunit D [Thermodesulfobacteriota bacterium]